MSINTSTFPAVIWTGLSPNSQRATRLVNAPPVSEDWDQIVAEMIAVQDSVSALLGDTGSGSQITNGDAVTETDTAVSNERMIYNPTGGTFTLNAPASPTIGTRWAIKNRSTSITSITVDGNTKNIEDPSSTFSLSTSFSLSGDGISVEWEYDGTQWLVI